MTTTDQENCTLKYENTCNEMKKEISFSFQVLARIEEKFCKKQMHINNSDSYKVKLIHESLAFFL